MSKKPKTETKKEKPKSKYSNAGKGDKPRTGISQDEWEERWENIFEPKVYLNKGMKKLINKVKDNSEYRNKKE
jgi:hypothetical protein